MVLLMVILTIIIGVSMDALIQYIQFRKKLKAEISSIPGIFNGNFNEGSVIIPRGLYYDIAHTWAHMEKGGEVKIGINDFLQHVTGPITRIKMKNPGEKIRKGDLLFTIIQEGKHLDIYSPISGTIMEQNNKLNADCSMINSSPYQEGWICTIEPSNWLKETQFMIMSDKTKEWIKNEFARLKDFLAKVNSPELNKVTLQDGGAVKNSVLTYFGPEIWEEFQNNFLNASK